MRRILLIATGGTIASKESGQGLAPAISPQELLECVPEATARTHLETLQLMNLDSTNIGPEHWLQISQVIEKLYDQYDGFVITHGTDTMAYTASALSYLIQSSPKPIVLTGAQKSISLTDTDARKNLSDSILYALLLYHNSMPYNIDSVSHRSKWSMILMDAFSLPWAFFLL